MLSSTEHKLKVLGFDLFVDHVFLRTNVGHRYRVAVSCDFESSGYHLIIVARSTHQLLPEKYSKDCISLVGRFVNQYVEGTVDL